jgi:hypothetical protein
VLVRDAELSLGLGSNSSLILQVTILIGCSYSLK